MRRGRTVGLALVLLALVLAACRPLKDPPRPGPPPLPAAPGGAPASPAIFTSGAGTTSPFYAPDPDVIVVDPSHCASIPANPTPPATTEPLPPAGAPGCYYAYSTPTIYFAPQAVPVSRSKDLVHWYPAGPLDSHGEPSGVAFDGDGPGVLYPLWAPSVLQTGANRFVMWFAEQYSGFGQMCLWSATATSPDGPFTYAHGPFCNTPQGGLIDPAPFVDSDGTFHLTYSGQGSASQRIPTRVFEVQLSPTGDEPVGPDHQLLEVLPAPNFEFPTIEGPSMMRAPNGSLYLFYSGNHWNSAGYKVGVAKCDTVAGPCNRIYSTPVLESRGAMLGPGGQAPFKDAAGNWQLAFHAWAAADLNATPLDGVLRSLRVLPLTFPDGNPKVG